MCGLHARHGGACAMNETLPTCRFCPAEPDDWCPACTWALCAEHARGHRGDYDTPCTQVTGQSSRTSGTPARPSDGRRGRRPRTRPLTSDRRQGTDAVRHGLAGFGSGWRSASSFPYSYESRASRFATAVLGFLRVLRCRAVWHKGARNSPRRCDLRRRHDGPHLSAQGMDDLWWIEKHVHMPWDGPTNGSRSQQ